jgi:WD40 repeat protein
VAGGEVTCVAYSANGKFVALGDDKGTVRVHFRASIGQAGAKFHTITVPGDSASSVAFTPDGAHLVVATSLNRRVQFYTVPSKTKHAPEMKSDFPTAHAGEIKSLRTAHFPALPMTVFVIVGAGDRDTVVDFWNPRGALLGRVNTNQVRGGGVA